MNQFPVECDCTGSLGCSGYNNTFKFLKSNLVERCAMTRFDKSRLDPLATTSPSTPILIGSPVFRRAAFGTNHPLSIQRVETVFDLLRCLGWFDPGAFVACPPASRDVISTYHDEPYLDALQRAEDTGIVEPSDRVRFNFGNMENPWFSGLFERAATTVGGSILAAKIAMQGRTVFHPSGGTHHGLPDRANGFCYFNDPVFAVLTFLEAGLQRIAYVDVDAHHGDGVELAFKRDPRVMTISVHEADRWPYSGTQSAPSDGIINLSVPAGCNDSEFTFCLDEIVLLELDAFDPEAVVITCGTDALAGDPLSRMRLSNRCLWDSVVAVCAMAPRRVIVGGGGYNPWTLARCWTGLWGVLQGKEMPDALPDDATGILSDLTCDLIDEDEICEAWLTELVDKRNPGDVRDAVRSLVAGS
ncbi:MAG: acetoin utilization protein AcuC [Hyphomicrobiaceae bacterium]